MIRSRAGHWSTYERDSSHENKAWAAVAAIGIGGFIIWLFWNRETTEWTTDVPQRFQGNWRLVEYYGSDNHGIRSIYLSGDVIVLAPVIDENEKDNSRYPIRKVSITSRRRSKAGEMVMFYGPADKDTIAQNRLQIYYDRNRKSMYRKSSQPGWERITGLIFGFHTGRMPFLPISTR